MVRPPRAHVRRTADHAEHGEEVQFHQAAHFRFRRFPGRNIEADAALLIKMSIAPNRSSVRSTTPAARFPRSDRRP